VLGTENVLAACATGGVRKIIVTSSGAAYGYHADNPVPLTESDPLRGNEAFAYSHHKRLVEERLARFAEEHPEVGQLVFRVGAVLGPGVDNQISALFERRFVLELAGSTAPFAFVWDEDVVGCLVEGVFSDKTGIYNVSGDGTLTPGQIAEILGKRRLVLPVALVKAALWLLSRLRLSPYGPEQTLFLQYRPVLANARLKGEFGYVPRRSSEEVFQHFAESRGLLHGA
jgi:UDP-glucose 4-epimerase